LATVPNERRGDFKGKKDCEKSVGIMKEIKVLKVRGKKKDIL